MDRFMFLYRGGAPQTPGLSAREVEAHLNKWEAWVAELTRDGRFERGEALGPGGQLVRRGGLVVDGPFAESKEAVGGYCVIRAANADEAAAIARQCPIFEYDGSVEVRRLEDGMCMDATDP